ncbi:MAG: hypothetical protein ACKPKO_47560, partial [Candidatus Fonsibacter sp.]
TCKIPNGLTRTKVYLCTISSDRFYKWVTILSCITLSSGLLYCQEKNTSWAYLIGQEGLGFTLGLFNWSRRFRLYFGLI